MLEENELRVQALVRRVRRRDDYGTLVMQGFVRRKLADVADPEGWRAHMRAQARGRIINVSSVLGFVPVPFGALYAASKHAIEGYSESVDHEVRQHGVRVLLVEPGFTKTAFDANIVPPGTTLAIYANERRLAEEVVAESLASGDAPSVVAAAVVRAATDAKPKLRYPAGRQARQLRTLRRVVPARAFDKQIHKFNRLPA